MKYMISGGGTGGHIFPAIAIADAIRRHDTDAEFLFVGAIGRMEMDRVPAAGYKITGLPVAGFSRTNILANFGVIVKLVRSMLKARRVVKSFCPDIAIGVGGYASGPVLKEAQRRGIPTLLQEQNSYAGVTNKLLAKKADSICVAYEGMDRFFPTDKIIVTGNPIRKNIVDGAKNYSREDAKNLLGFSPEKKLLVITGGSLGARTINRSVAKDIDSIIDADINVLWQTGKFYIDEYRPLSRQYPSEKVKIVPFLDRMDLVYAAADLIVARAGASTISEIQATGAAALLVPSPNVAEDHQTHNAMALASRGAAAMEADATLIGRLYELVKELMNTPGKLESMAMQASKMGILDSDDRIAELAVDIALKNKTRSKNEK